MIKYRLYGAAPVRVVIVHGGPGAPGEVAPIARELEDEFGILEPMQSATSIKQQLEELRHQILEYTTPPVYLIGHSWGAWLSLLFAAQNPQLVQKLILISCGSLESSYTYDMNATRLQRLSDEERSRLHEVYQCLEEKDCEKASEAFKSFGILMSKMDSYDPIDERRDILEYQYSVYRSIWPEAMALRESSELLSRIAEVHCPVVAIHGDYDPHPAAGVEEPLRRILQDFHFHLLPKCGHTPWREHHAREAFFHLLREELK